MTSTAPGGFIAQTTSYLPSPTPTNYSSTTSTREHDLLPTPRPTPLKSGSKRESLFINYVDNAFLDISRKFVKKFPADDEEKAEIVDGSDVGRSGVVGYKEVETLIRDLERLVELVWVSGTGKFPISLVFYYHNINISNYKKANLNYQGNIAHLQIAYLLQIASKLINYLPPFPPRPTPTFRILNRLDLAFHLLIQDYKMNATEKVRLNSIVKVTRAMILRLMEGRDFSDGEDEDLDREREYENEGDADDEDDDELDDDEDEYEDKEKEGMEVDSDTEGEVSKFNRQYQQRRPTQKEIDRTERRIEEEAEDDGWEMECAKVYSRVLEDIGGDLGGDPIGIVVDE